MYCLANTIAVLEDHGAELCGTFADSSEYDLVDPRLTVVVYTSGAWRALDEAGDTVALGPSADQLDLLLSNR